MMRSIPRISISMLTLAALVLATEGCGPELFVKHRPAGGVKPRVAVLRFQDAPGQTGSGSVATDVFSAQLLSVDAYDVIDRGAIDKVIEEQKLAARQGRRAWEAHRRGRRDPRFRHRVQAKEAADVPSRESRFGRPGHRYPHRPGGLVGAAARRRAEPLADMGRPRDRGGRDGLLAFRRGPPRRGFAPHLSIAPQGPRTLGPVNQNFSATGS